MNSQHFRIICLCFIMSVFLSDFSGNASAQQDSKKSPSVHTQVMNKLETMTPDENVEVLMGTEKELYKVGDAFEIRFQVSRPGYITLMDISPNGKITFLLPSIKLPENRVETDKTYSTLHDFNMPITIAHPAGYETINLFYSTEKIDLFETDFAQEPFYTITKDDDERLQDLLARLDILEEREWSGSSVQFLIQGTTRGVPRKFGALPPLETTGTTGKFFPPLDTTGTTGKTE